MTVILEVLMSYPLLFGCAFCTVAIISQLVSSLVVILRQGRRDDLFTDLDIGVSILRPVCGVENYIEETLRSTFQLNYPRYEVIFCAAKPDDPVIPIVQRLIEAHPDVEARLLIGNTTVSANPKLNNLVKGWNDARYDWILMADSNVQMPGDHVQRMLSAWRDDTGLVCSPPIGGEPRNLWAELECAFLNTYQGRWQCFADSIGFGFAQGKAMLWQRELLNLAGGIEVLGSELAEDAAATKAVRALGLRVRLVAQPFMQPLGSRSPAEVWRRQVRWARLRRTTFKFFFVPELLAGLTPPLIVAMVMALAAGYSVVDVALPLIVGWYAVEALLAYKAGWHLSHRSIFIWMLRDALLPVLWISAWAGNDFEWRGNSMSVAIEASH